MRTSLTVTTGAVCLALGPLASTLAASVCHALSSASLLTSGSPTLGWALLYVEGLVTGKGCGREANTPARESLIVNGV